MINEDVIKPLPEKEIHFDKWYIENHPNKIPVIKRVLFFSPSELYKKVERKINPNKRHQGIGMEDIFPKRKEIICACGCGETPKNGINSNNESWHRKFATDSCQSFCNDVLSIMNNYFGVPAKYISFYYGKKCIQCSGTTGLELDHIIGVKHGGGACWLSNYRWLCKACHNSKTNKDFNRGEFKNPEQIKLL